MFGGDGGFVPVLGECVVFVVGDRAVVVRRSQGVDLFGGVRLEVTFVF